MSYITQADLANYIDSQQLIAMTDDLATGVVNQTILGNVLQMASDKVDSLVSAIYQVPFAAPVPVKIRTAAAVFAAEMLYNRRLTPTEKNPLTPQADMLRQELMDINRGLLSLDYASRRAFTPIVVGSSYNRANSNIY